MGVNNCILFVLSNTYVRTFQKKGRGMSLTKSRAHRYVVRRSLAIYIQIAQPNSKM